MIDNIAVGRTIARLRQNKNMTQQQLAATLSVSHQAVSKWETGAALPDVQTLMALTRLFGITVEQLLEGEVPEDRMGPQKPASPFDEPIQNIGNFVSNIVTGIFGSPKEAEDDGAMDAETPETEAEYEDAPASPAGEDEQNDSRAVEFDVQSLLQMAPFMSKSAVDELLLEHRGRLTAGDIARFAPFASQECLEKLIQSNESEINWDVLRRVAPFLKREMVDRLTKAAARGSRCVKKAAGQAGIDTDELGKTVQDVGQKIGEGVGKALRRASKLGDEVSSAINGLVDGVKDREGRAEALRRAACERALQDENWDWLAEHIADQKDEELLREIARKANALGKHDWVLEHMDGYADTSTIDAAIEEGNWGWLGDHVWQFEDELQEKVARAAAQRENWQWLSTYAEQIALDNCADEIAIAAYRAEARVLAEQIARHCMDDAQRRKLADEMVAAGDFDALRKMLDILEPAYIGGNLVAMAQRGSWEHVGEFIDSADDDSVRRLMELAIAEGNYDAMDLVDRYL